MAVLPQVLLPTHLASADSDEAHQRTETGQVVAAGAHAREQRIGVRVAKQVLKLNVQLAGQSPVLAQASHQHPVSFVETRLQLLMP